jgi:hypothetical protein
MCDAVVLGDRLQFRAIANLAAPPPGFRQQVRFQFALRTVLSEGFRAEPLRAGEEGGIDDRGLFRAAEAVFAHHVADVVGGRVHGGPDAQPA